MKQQGDPQAIERSRNRERGFSMLEMAVVGTLILIISAITLIQLPPALQAFRSDTALREVVDQMRQAREYAIANRRYIQITFPTINGLPQIQITQRNDLTAGAGAVNPVLSTVPIQAPMNYVLTASMGDTPDKYGNTSAIEFEGVMGGPPGGMLFQSDGELVDGGTVAGGAATPINGSIFLGVLGQPSAARAVTVMGTTGRIHGWKGSGATWTQF